MQTLEPTEEKVFFIADSHRPYDVCNIYNDGQVIFPSNSAEVYPPLSYGLQVYLLGKSNEKEEIPSFEDIFGNEEVHKFFLLYFWLIIGLI